MKVLFFMSNMQCCKNNNKGHFVIRIEKLFLKENIDKKLVGRKFINQKRHELI